MEFNGGVLFRCNRPYDFKKQRGWILSVGGGRE